MPDTVIRTTGLSKKYVISHEPRGGLRHAVENLARSPFRRGHRLWARLTASAGTTSAPAGEEVKAEIGGPTREDFWALRDVSFDVRQGDVVGIIGRNGAGKSTLLKILSQITEPTSGRVEIHGRVSSLLEVGTGFHPELTGRENIFLNGAILGMTRVEIARKFDEIVAFAEIEQFMDTPVKRYSSGMYVRLAFAVAAHLEPDILIVDEVLAVGDMKFQMKCLGKMREVSSAGRTVVFVTHQMGTITALCTRAIYLAHGRVELDGSVSEVVSAYLAGVDVAQGERVWRDLAEAPGGKKARIVAVRTKVDGATAAHVDMGKPVEVELDFINHVDGAFLSPSVHLFDEGGSLILCTGNQPAACHIPDPWANRRFPKGHFRSTCTFPANFFNERSYSLSFFVVHDNATIEARADQALSFRTYDTGSMRGDYSGEWHGMLRQKLHWQTSGVETS